MKGYVNRDYLTRTDIKIDFKAKIKYKFYYFFEKEKKNQCVH